MSQPAEHQRGGGFGGILLIVIGVLFLGTNYGWWGVDFWWVLAGLWPVLLILLGVRLLLPRSRVFGWIILALVLGLFAAIASMPERFEWVPGNAKIESSQSFSDAIGDAKKLRFELKFGAAEVDLRPAPSDSSKLYQADFTDTPEISKAITMDGDTVVVVLREASHTGMMWGPKHRGVTVQLTRKIPVEVVLDSGAAKVTADLSDIMAEDIDINAGAASVDLKLGRSTDKATGSIDIGASALKLSVPKEYALRIRHDGGLSSHNFSDVGLQRSGDIYSTGDYSGSAKSISLDIDAGASSIQLIRYE